MNRNQEDQPWEDRFRQLGNIRPAQPRPFFYTRLEARLKARLEQPELAARLPWWLQRPAYALGTLGVLIALNVSVAMWQNRPPAPETDPGTYEAFVQDYQLDHQTVYADE
ncbi:hypothetical protein GCM10028803_43260 [Larkinella knui]|uniref:Uncharacterized protein n=1 Tax=Larkinella knui TaxID=2025310 RepID=A0A3P1CNQ6_9BACT|nr:hypothetical protein [Larkinella knui]RRB14951.1 hypothetical protein EHT87_10320 [Larkinella knui]